MNYDSLFYTPCTRYHVWTADWMFDLCWQFEILTSIYILPANYLKLTRWDFIELIITYNLLTSLLDLNIIYVCISNPVRCPAFTKLSDDTYLFKDGDQCDKYWTCKGGQSRRSLCPDGLVFHPNKPAGEDPCDLKHNVPDKCQGRQNLQRPKPGEWCNYFAWDIRNDIYVSQRLDWSKFGVQYTLL